MGKMDPKYLKKLAQGIIEHIGQDSEGEDPEMPDQDDDPNGAGTNLIDDPNLRTTSGDHFGPFPGSEEPDKKKKKFNEGGAGGGKKAAAMALLASNLASKFNKPGER